MSKAQVEKIGKKVGDIYLPSAIHSILTASLSQSPHPGVRAILLRGPAGVGKTSRLSEAQASEGERR